jgi:hypothetical protein
MNPNVNKLGKFTAVGSAITYKYVFCNIQVEKIQNMVHTFMHLLKV